MKTTIQTLTEQGRRKNNEDSISSTPEQGLFIVCDGVGGSHKGEVASNIVCTGIKQYFKDNISANSTSHDIDNAVRTVEVLLDNYVAANRGSSGMATTLTLLHLQQDSATIAHIGDSRVYQVRDGEIIFKTFDHSLVNELVASGNLTPEDAKNHPNKNMITRAVQGTKHPATADVKVITDILYNDYFLLCTDGILEGIDDEYIARTFTADANVTGIINDIKAICDKGSDDNFSAILVKIAEPGPEEGVVAGVTNDKPQIQAFPARDHLKSTPQTPVEPARLNKFPKRLVLFIILMAGGALAFYYFWPAKSNKNNTGNPDTVAKAATAKPVKKVPGTAETGSRAKPTGETVLPAKTGMPVVSPAKLTDSSPKSPGLSKAQVSASLRDEAMKEIKAQRQAHIDSIQSHQAKPIKSRADSVKLQAVKPADSLKTH